MDMQIQNWGGKMDCHRRATTEAGQQTLTSYFLPISSASKAKNSSVGVSNDNWTLIFLRAGLLGLNVSSAFLGKRGSRGAGGATKITFSVFARTTLLHKTTATGSSRDSRRRMVVVG